MAAPNPQVSVFHFTSRISSAKIRKYKLATERGMGGGGGSGTAASPARGTLRESPSPSLDPSSMEPPAKRPRLKLNVRPPSESPDTIAVSRPKRDSTLRIRYSENMIIDSKDLEEEIKQRKPRPSPAASSDLSSLTSVHSIEKEPPVAEAPAASSAKLRDYSRDFMSYYVDGGDDGNDDEETSQPQPLLPEQSQPKHAPSPEPTPGPEPARAKSDSANKNHADKQYIQPPSYPTAKLQPPRPTLPQPIIQVIDTPQTSTAPLESNTVATMVAKLEALSNALTSFGGIPAIPESPQEESSQEEAPPKEKKDVDNFLAMFDDDDSDGTENKNDTRCRNLNYKLPNPGDPDSPLTYGIQFIQNALRSWAVQRTTAQYSQQWTQYQRAREAPKRGPGRPRKFDNGDEEPRPPPPPSLIRIDLAKTQEGAAIAAFQDVLDSGCLQVNAVLPVQLTRALRRLYLQIDHLINQGSRNEPQWQCMSYGAQIAAQKIRVDKWKDAHAKAQQEMSRQQHLAQQQVMQQMGIPQHHRSQLTVEQAQHQHAIELERKRSLQHAAQQPHLTQYLTNPLRLNTQPKGVSSSHTPLASSINVPASSSPGGGPSNGQAAPYPHGLPSEHSSADGRGVHLDKIKLYMPNFLPRSGQSMKFSFAPHNELALKTFGPQAFPTNQSGPNIPNRGPMSANPPIPISHAHMPNGGYATPVVPSNVPKPSAPKDNDVQMMDVVQKEEAQPAPRVPNGAVRPSSAGGSGTSSEVRNYFPKPAAAANGSTSDKRSSSLSAASPPMHSPGMQNRRVNFSVPPSPIVSNHGGAGMNQTSQYLHTQAVVID